MADIGPFAYLEFIWLLHCCISLTSLRSVNHRRSSHQAKDGDLDPEGHSQVFSIGEYIHCC